MEWRRVFMASKTIVIDHSAVHIDRGRLLFFLFHLSAVQRRFQCVLCVESQVQLQQSCSHAQITSCTEHTPLDVMVEPMKGVNAVLEHMWRHLVHHIRWIHWDLQLRAHWPRTFITIKIQDKWWFGHKQEQCYYVCCDLSWNQFREKTNRWYLKSKIHPIFKALCACRRTEHRCH